jgi:hypothetical protein
VRCDDNCGNSQREDGGQLEIEADSLNGSSKVWAHTDREEEESRRNHNSAD